MDLLETRNIARGRCSHRIRHTRSRGRLSRSHTYTHINLSLRIRVEIPFIPGATSTIPANAVKVNPVNHLLHSIKSTYISIKSSTYISIKSSCHFQTTLTHIERT